MSVFLHALDLTLIIINIINRMCLELLILYAFKPVLTCHLNESSLINSVKIQHKIHMCRDIDFIDSMKYNACFPFNLSIIAFL